MKHFEEMCNADKIQFIEENFFSDVSLNKTESDVCTDLLNHILEMESPFYRMQISYYIKSNYPEVWLASMDRLVKEAAELYGKHQKEIEREGGYRG